MYYFEFQKNVYGLTVETWIVSAETLEQAREELKRIGGDGAAFIRAYPLLMNLAQTSNNFTYPIKEQR